MHPKAALTEPFTTDLKGMGSTPNGIYVNVTFLRWLDRVRVALLVCCAFFAPWGNGLQNLAAFDVSKIFVACSGLLVCYWLFFVRGKLTYVPREFILFSLFVLCHTFIVYSLFFPHEFQLGYVGSSPSANVDGFDVVHESISIHIARYIFFTLFTCALASTCRSKRDLATFAISSGLGIISVSLLSLTVFSQNIGNYSQVTGGVLDPNVWGFCAVTVVWLLMYVVAITNRNRPMRMLACGLALYTLLILVESLSRASILAFCVGVLILLLLIQIQHLKLAILLLVVAGGLLLCFFWEAPILEPFRGRFDIENILAGMGSGRVSTWLEYLRCAPAYLVSGVGMGRSRGVLSNMMFNEAATHNIFLETFVEYGMIGLFLLLRMFVSVYVWITRKGHHRPPTVGRAIMITLLVSVVFNSLFLNVYGLRSFWISLGLLFAYGSLCQRENAMAMH